MFKPVTSKVSFPKMEGKVLSFWRKNRIFQKTLEKNRDKERYVFYEGPPTANGLPGIHHVLARAFKDLFPRYQTMKGRYVLRKGGWDTHGLPVELEVEKEIGSTGKGDIEKFGIAAFNQRCKESVFRYVKEWERLTERIGFWIDMVDPYVTYHNSYIESEWWILKQLWDRGLLYRGYKVTMHCPRCSTSLADHEVALGFRDGVEDPSVWVLFRVEKSAPGPLADLLPAAFLAWTTTPWTLPANLALAVKGDADYLVVDYAGQRLILAAALADQVLGHDKYAGIRTVKGADLVGVRYARLFDGVPAPGDVPDLGAAYRVIADEIVSLEDGTGIVHVAPAYGDLEVGKRAGLPTLFSVDLKGEVMPELSKFAGRFFKDADPLIIADLNQRGLLLRSERVTHSYPFCWRCNAPLLYYAKSSWYIKTTAVKDRLIWANNQINWYPTHIKEGRFGNWLENNIDWALSRERYWGTPLPIWQCESCGSQECIGSVAELRQKAESSRRPVEWDKLDLHRPYIDEVEWECARCGGTMRRLPEVLDCWFDSGAMPVAQWHYPFENQGRFTDQYPADFICEAIDQTRGWFYSLHALSVLLFDQPCYKNCVVLGHILDSAGQKMSKSKGNVVDPWEVLNGYGADALRWYLYTGTPLGNPYRFGADQVVEVLRRFLLTLWNTYSFFVTYANLDVADWKREMGSGIMLSADHPPASSLEPLDRWVLSELTTLVGAVNKGLDAYDVAGAARAIERFVDDLSNWYVRRSRRRFWSKAGFSRKGDLEKRAAYGTLYTCLVTLSKLLAPFMPFVAEEMYRNLVRLVDAAAPESVHLCDFPEANAAFLDEKLMEETRLVMRTVSLGRAARSKANLRVRLPLARVMVKVKTTEEQAALERLADQVMDELNVKALEFAEDEARLLSYTVKPMLNLLGPKYGKRLPAIRAALEKADAAQVAAWCRAGKPVALDLEGETVTLFPEEVLVQAGDREGFAVAEEGGYLVGVDTRLTAELMREGFAREVVRYIQDMRKAAGFEITDNIVSYLEGGPGLREALEAHGTYVRQETLSRELHLEAAPVGAHAQTVEIEGESVTLGVVRCRQ